MSADPSLTSPLDTDAVIIGAGPVGLFQVFQLGLQELRAHVVDSLPHVGGQCAELYADKPIYDIPAVRQCTGQQLADALLQQARPFAPQFHLHQQVTALQRHADGRFMLTTSRGTQLRCRVVVIAAGVGAFEPRKLKVPGLERFEGMQVLHGTPDDAVPLGRQVFVVGNDEAALHGALAIAARDDGAHRVTLLHRRDDFDATAATVARLREALAQGALDFRIGQITGFEATEGRLTHIAVMGGDGLSAALAADSVIVQLGLSPRLGPLADWGLAMQRKQLVVDPATSQTSEPGIFAVGDIVTYPGKRKLIVCGFHEATMAAFAAAAHVRPEQPVLLQYTTTSPRLHALLGVAPHSA